MKVQSLFAVPIVVDDLADLELINVQHEIKKIMDNIDPNSFSVSWGTVLTTFNYQSKNNVIEVYELNQLKNSVIRNASVLCEIERIRFKEIFISESWINLYKKGSFQFDHTHPGSLFSGSYYYQTNQKDGNIVFRNPNNVISHRRSSDPNYQQCSATFTPQVGRLLVFPDWLVHRVEVNNTDDDRISIAFNILVR